MLTTGGFSCERYSMIWGRCSSIYSAAPSIFSANCPTMDAQTVAVFKSDKHLATAKKALLIKFVIASFHASIFVFPST